MFISFSFTVSRVLLMRRVNTKSKCLLALKTLVLGIVEERIAATAIVGSTIEKTRCVEEERAASEKHTGKSL